MPTKLKRILALCGVILLVLMYVITLIFAFIDPTLSKDWLKASIFVSILVPVLLYSYILIYKFFKK